jgi:hypothetical protein
MLITDFENWISICYTRCLKIREFRIQSVVGKDPVELEKYVVRKNTALPEEDISTLILLFCSMHSSHHVHCD